VNKVFRLGPDFLPRSRRSSNGRARCPRRGRSRAPRSPSTAPPAP
jgi:hypothetical protein